MGPHVSGTSVHLTIAASTHQEEIYSKLERGYLMAVRIYYYDPFSSEAKILPNNSFVICNLGELLLILLFTKCTN